MSFNLKNLNMTCAPMYNAQNNNEIMGYMCNSNFREGFQSSVSYAYDNSKTYKEKDIVIYKNNSYILPKFIGAAGYNPIDHKQYWLPYKPNYDNFITYKVDDIVTFQNNFYIMKHFIGAAGYAPPTKPQNWFIYDPKAPTPATVVNNSASNLSSSTSTPLQRGTPEYKVAFNKFINDPAFAIDNDFDKALENSPQYVAYSKAAISFNEEYNAARATLVGDDLCVIPRFNKTAQKLHEKQLATQAPLFVAAAKAYDDAAAMYNKRLMEGVKKYNLPSDNQSMIDQGFFLKDKFGQTPRNPIIESNLLINIDPSDPNYANC
jgi:hypothetical protein